MTEPDAVVRRMLGLALEQVGTHALVLIDPEGTIIGWRAGAERLFGYRAPEIIGRPDATLFVPEDVAQGMNLWERQTAISSGESEDDRWQLRKDGARIWVSGTLTVLRGPGGEVEGFAKIMRDRTDQKTQVEALEGRLAAFQRTQGQRIEFVSTLAHELRSPLAAMSNAGGMLEAAASRAPEVKFALGSIRRQVGFMTHMIDDLLEVARTATGKTLLHKAAVVLQDVLAHSLEACRPSIDQRGHAVVQLMPGPPIQIEGDAVRLRQVFTNLIDNASKYAPARGSIWIKLATEGDEAVVRVRDTGAGISPEVMPHIFELFTQGESAARAQTGLGIGLAVVRETVALHGGTVQATSDGVGKGSEFTVRLPLVTPG